MELRKEIQAIRKSKLVVTETNDDPAWPIKLFFEALERIAQLRNIFKNNRHVSKFFYGSMKKSI